MFVAGAGLIVERKGEIASIRAAVARARAGDGALLIVDGEPGVGKSLMCATAAAIGQEAGMRVLGARGGEIEHDLSYGVVRQLFERHLHQADPEVAAKALRGSARLARSALAIDVAESRDLTPGAIDHGLFWLIANLAETEPLVLIVDDAHWADHASLRSLLYLARRLEAMPVMLVAARREVSGGNGRLLGLLSDEPLAVRVSPRTLSKAGVRELLAAQLGREPAEETVSACHQATGGNPFFVSEVARSLADGSEREQLAGAAAASTAPEALTHSILMRLGLQPQNTRAVAEALAVVGEGASIRLICAMTGQDRDDVVGALDRLAMSGIASRTGALSCAHPIVRTAIYGDLAPWRRQQLHARAARALAAAGERAEEVAHHLLLTDPDGDESTARLLRRAARRARAQGSADHAVRLLARALHEPPAAAERAVTMLELGEAELEAGRPSAAAGHLTDALSDLPIGEERVRAAVAAAGALIASAGPDEAFALLATEAGHYSGEPALRLEVERATLAMWVRATVPSPWLDQTLAHFGSLPGESPAQRLGLAQAALGAAYDPSADAAHAATLARRALSDGDLLAELGADAIAVGMACYVLVMAEDLEVSVVETDRMLADARDRGSKFGLAGALLLRGQIAHLRGQLADAAAEFEQALTAARELPKSPISDRCIAFSASWLVETLLDRGDDAAAQAAIASSQAAGDFDDPNRVWARFGRGLLRLRADDTAGAVEDLLAFGEAARAGGYEDRHAMWRLGAAQALAASGRDMEALALADEQVSIARAWSPAAHGAALRVRALVGPAGEATATLERAVDLLSGSELVLQRSHTLIDYGVALRRNGQRTKARLTLEAGLDLAARCEALPLIARARSELVVLGARPRRLMFSGIEGLTATERRVAAMAAEGMSNRQIAEAMFVTMKTVESHLRNAYRKLDIASRGELSAKLSGRDVATEPVH